MAWKRKVKSNIICNLYFTKQWIIMLKPRQHFMGECICIKPLDAPTWWQWCGWFLFLSKEETTVAVQVASMVKIFLFFLCTVDHCKDKVWPVEVDVISFWWTSYMAKVEKKDSNAIALYYSWALTSILTKFYPFLPLDHMNTYYVLLSTNGKKILSVITLISIIFTMPAILHRCNLF